MYVSDGSLGSDTVDGSQPTPREAAPLDAALTGHAPDVTIEPAQ